MKNSLALVSISGALDVGAGIEEADFDRSQLRLHLCEERLDSLFIAHIGTDGACDAAGRDNLLHEAARLLGIAPRYADGVAASGESPRHCGANRVSGANQQRHSALPAFDHRPVPHTFLNHTYDIVDLRSEAKRSL